MRSEYSYAQKVMGVSFDVTIVADNVTTADALFAEAFGYAQAYDARCSRFRPDSELSQLNAHGALVGASPQMLSALTLGRTLYTETDGAFNPLVRIDALGYDVSFDTPHFATAPRTASQTHTSRDWSTVLIDTDSATVQFPDGQHFDTGGFLKGHVAQLIADHVMAHATLTAHGVIINLGGDLAVRGADADGHDFVFDIVHPDTDQVTSIPLRDTCLSTSGTYKRTWQIEDGERHHHIIAPALAENPPHDIISASVIHTSGARSDAYATAAIVLGTDDAANFLAAHDAQYLLIAKDGTIQTNLTVIGTQQNQADQNTTL